MRPETGAPALVPLPVRVGGSAAQQLGVAPAELDELLVAATLDDLTRVEHEDLVGVADRRQAVGDRDRRASARELVQRLLHGALGLVVKRRRRLVEDQHRRVAQDGARDRHALLLAAREAIAALADGRVIAIGQRGDQLVDLRRASGVFDLLVAGVRAGEAQVLADRLVKQIRLLRDHADRVGERGERHVADVHAVDAHAAALRLV